MDRKKVGHIEFVERSIKRDLLRKYIHENCSLLLNQIHTSFRLALNPSAVTRPVLILSAIPTPPFSVLQLLNQPGPLLLLPHDTPLQQTFTAFFPRDLHLGILPPWPSHFHGILRPNLPSIKLDTAIKAKSEVSNEVVQAFHSVSDSSCMRVSRPPSMEYCVQVDLLEGCALLPLHEGDHFTLRSSLIVLKVSFQSLLPPSDLVFGVRGNRQRS